MTIRMKELKELMRVLIAIFRYPAAIVVAFVASMATVIYLPGLFPERIQNDDSTFWDFAWFFSTGLAGVAAGSFCLPRYQRWIGSWCLLLLGLGFAFFVFCACSEDDSGGDNLFPLVPLAAGGIIPVVIHYLFRRKQPTKTAL
jgi:hypothetical protein